MNLRQVIEARVQAWVQRAGGGSDVTHFSLARGQAAVVFIRGLADADVLRQHAQDPRLAEAGAGEVLDLLAPLRPRRADPDDALLSLLSGEAVLLLPPPQAQPWVLHTSGWKERDVQSPSTETSIRGPRDAFIENIEVNIALVRRRLRSPAVHVEEHRVGSVSRTRVAVLYHAERVSTDLLREVRARLRQVGVAAVSDASHLGELMAGPYWTPFPLYLSTERPDRVADALVTGKVIVMTDGSPWAIVAPVRVLDLFFSVDDYYVRPTIATLLRLTRLMGWIGLVLFPAMYVALEAYNPEVLRVELALTIEASRTGVPLNVVLEAIYIIVMMELIQETAIRLPEKIGGATTIVGALIIGEAVARARIVSDIVIVIIAMAAIGSLSLPDREAAAAWRISSILLLAAASVMGGVGVVLGLIALVFHLNSLESFGVPYLAPLAPPEPGELIRDGLVRVPRWTRASRASRGRI